MSKEIYFNKEARALMLEGVNMAADAITSTWGPNGKTVVINPGIHAFPIMTKDGVTVSASISLKDPVKNTGVMMIRNACEATVKDAGDNTTTAAGLAQYMINEGVKAVEAGGNAQEIKSGMEKAVTYVVNALKDMSVPLTDNDMIKSIGTISANNDEEIGAKLAEAYGKIGNNGMLTIEMSKTHETYVTIMEGAEMTRGFANEKFVTNRQKMLIEYENPYVLVFNYEIKVVNDIVPFLQDFSKLHDLKVTPLVIIANGYEAEFYNSMVVNKEQYGAKICLIEAPNMYQGEALVDMATITGATLITDDAGLKPIHAKIEHLGTCKKIVVSRFNTLIIDGAGDKEKVDLLKKQLEVEMETTKDEKVKEVFEKRLARLSGSIGVIYVGGATHVEQTERLHRVDDANRSVKSAIEEGIVPGGGIALIRAAMKFNMSQFEGGELIGAYIVFNACYVPLKKMLLNSGIEEEKVLPSIDSNNPNFGFNLKTKKFVDMMDAKIIDPTKAVRCALQNAVSVAGQVINSDVLLVEVN